MVFKRYVGPNEHVLGDAVVSLVRESLVWGREREKKIELWKLFPGKERESMLYG